MILLKIDGMTCAHCVSAVRKAVLKLDPGADVAVNFSAGTAEVSGKATAERIASAIEAEGYKATVTSETRA